MKRLVAFIGIMLITAIAVGQRSPESRIRNKGGDTYVISDLVKRFPNSTIQSQAATRPYQFVANGYVFLLSYDSLKNEKEIENRPVYLFYYDGINWSKASDIIQYDNPNNYYYTAVSENRIEHFKSGQVAMRITNYVVSTHAHVDKIIIFTPIGNKRYSFETHGK
jgi:hypothetical protein